MKKAKRIFNALGAEAAVNFGNANVGNALVGRS